MTEQPALILFQTKLTDAMEEAIVAYLEENPHQGGRSLRGRLSHVADLQMHGVAFDLENNYQPRSVSVLFPTHFDHGDARIDLTVCFACAPRMYDDSQEVAAEYARTLHVNPFASSDDTYSHIADRLAEHLCAFLMDGTLPRQFKIAYDR